MREEQSERAAEIASTQRHIERLRKERLYTDKSKDEYVDLDAKTAHKVTNLLESQKDMTSNDVEALFAAADEIQGANCHKTALYLTNKYSENDLFATDNDDPQTAGHEYIEGNSRLYPEFKSFLRAISRKKFPCRVSFFKEKDGKQFAFHSITILGISNKGKLKGFEKAGPYADNPFAYINAVDVISAYIQAKYTPGVEK